MKALLVSNSNKYVGGGSFGRVQEVAVDLKPNIAVLHKMGYVHANTAPGDLVKEVKVPKLLHERAGGFQNGIQRAPYSIMNVKSATDIRWGVYVHRYNRTLEHKNVANINMKPKQLLQGLFTGLRAVHTAGIAHRDIKPENAGLQRNPKGKYESCLADFGLASLRENPSKEVSGTPSFLTVMDHYAQSDDTLTDDARLNLQQKQDIYALGVTALMTIASQLTDPKSVQNLYEAIDAHCMLGAECDKPLRTNPVVSELLNIIEEDCGPKISSLLYAMLNPDPRLRPSAKQAEVDFKGGFRG